MENIKIDGNTPIPADAWKEYYQEFVEEIENEVEIERKEQEKNESLAKATVEHMKKGIQNPPSTLDAAMEFLTTQYQLFGNESTGNPTQAILDIVIKHNKNPSIQFDADQLNDIEKYIDANYGNIMESGEDEDSTYDDPSEPVIFKI
jgi:hypothetical protein